MSATALGKSGTISLPEIHLKDLGKGNDGLTPAELSQKVLGVLIEEASKQATSVVADLTKGATYMGKEFGKTPTNATEKVTKGRIMMLDGSHLFPMEKPEATAAAIEAALRNFAD